jgi:hypothetical protein
MFFMKKLFALVVLAVSVWSCNNPDSTKPAEATSAHKEEHLEHSATKEALQLNNGVKWKADSVTNINVKNLETIIKNYNDKKDKTLNDYKNAAGELQKGIDKMISECKMQGADHEALHKWLEPLIEEVTELKLSATVEDAAKVFTAMHTQVSRYYQYFE